ncbi:MAG: ATP-binding protein [Acidobacteriota bacterium]|nr:MAG: ATP-binding protein [Acidobacteriota bacterium]
MTRGRIATLTAGLLVFAAALAIWAGLEARNQRLEIRSALETQAVVLARSLGPALSAASAASDELDEVVSWKLLDNARLIADLDAAGALPDERLPRIIEDNGLDTLMLIDDAGELERWAGAQVRHDLHSDLLDLLEGLADELLLGRSIDSDGEHIAAAVARPGGGAVLVRTHPASAFSFVRRLGVENLLRELVGRAGVLYVVYQEQPSGNRFEVSWDGGPAPAPPSAATAPQQVRGRSSFEVPVEVDAPAGESAELRVGLDASPLRRAEMLAMRRTLLVGIVLAGLGLTGVGFAMVTRLRAREREESQRRLAAADEARRRSERLAAAGALTAGLAHEVRSPLNAISLAAQRIARQHDEASECRAFADRIRGEVTRLEAVLGEFLDLARPTSEQRTQTDLAELAREVIILLQDEAALRGVRFDPVQGRASAEINREAVRRALVNLVKNGIQLSPAGGKVSIAVDQRDRRATIRVRDEGPGIDPQLEDKLFDAFVTGRADGTGLGLSLVRRVVDEHAGAVRLANLPAGGAEAVIELPVSAEA